jgi:hypothetical protein
MWGRAYSWSKTARSGATSAQVEIDLPATAPVGESRSFARRDAVAVSMMDAVAAGMMDAVAVGMMDAVAVGMMNERIGVVELDREVAQ